MSRGNKGTPKAKKLPKGAHKPRSPVVGEVHSEKTPRREFTPRDPDGKLIILFSRIDVDSEWCLTKITESDHRDLLTHIRSFESMSVHEVFSTDGRVGMDYDIPDLPNGRALQRLADLDYDDRDQISRLRIGGKQRLYGFREGPRFYALWWDPEHEIWPTSKR